MSCGFKYFCNIFSYQIPIYTFKFAKLINMIMFHSCSITLSSMKNIRKYTQTYKKQFSRLFKYKVAGATLSHKRSFTLSKRKTRKELSIQLQRYKIISLLTKLSVHTCNNNSNQKRPVHTRSIIHVTYEPQTNLAVYWNATAFDIYTSLRGILQLSFRSTDFSEYKYI